MNYCISSTQIFVGVDTLVPDLFVKDDTINCQKPLVDLSAISDTQNVIYDWKASGADY